MSRNDQKTPLTRNLPIIAQKKVLEELHKLGAPLPCHVVSLQWPFVTVAFDVANALLPKVQAFPVMFQYANMPIQVNEKGWVFPCPMWMGSVTGIGPSDKLADFEEQWHNLAALMFMPAANAKWEQPGDVNAVTVWGPNGVTLQDVAGDSPNYTLKVNSSGINLTGGGFNIKLTDSTIKLSGGGHSVEINSTGILMDGHPYADHEHLPGTYVAGSTPVTGDSAGVVPGT